MIIGVRNEIQRAVEALALSPTRVINAATPAQGFAQPDRIHLTIPLGYTVSGSAAQGASSLVVLPGEDPDLRVTVQVYDAHNPPPPGVPLGTLDMQFVFATKR